MKKFKTIGKTLSREELKNISGGGKKPSPGTSICGTPCGTQEYDYVWCGSNASCPRCVDNVCAI